MHNLKIKQETDTINLFNESNHQSITFLFSTGRYINTEKLTSLNMMKLYTALSVNE